MRSLGFAPKSWTPVYENNDAGIELSNTIIAGRERAERVDIRKHCSHRAVQNGYLRPVRVSAWSRTGISSKGLEAQPSVYTAARESNVDMDEISNILYLRATHKSPPACTSLQDSRPSLGLPATQTNRFFAGSGRVRRGGRSESARGESRWSRLVESRYELCTHASWRPRPDWGINLIPAHPSLRSQEPGKRIGAG